MDHVLFQELFFVHDVIILWSKFYCDEIKDKGIKCNACVRDTACFFNGVVVVICLPERNRPPKRSSAWFLLVISTSLYYHHSQ